MDISQSDSSAQAAAAEAGYTGRCPVRFLVSPQMEIPQPLWLTHREAALPHISIMTPEFFQITEDTGGKAPLPLHVPFWVLPAAFLPKYFYTSFYKSHFAQIDLVYQVIQITWCLLSNHTVTLSRGCGRTLSVEVSHQPLNHWWEFGAVLSPVLVQTAPARNIPFIDHSLKAVCTN